MTAADSPAPETLLTLLQTDPLDAGCGQTMELLHVYVDQIVAGTDPEQAHPGITAHLRNCGPCLEDFDGLIAAVRADLA